MGGAHIEPVGFIDFCSYPEVLGLEGKGMEIFAHCAGFSGAVLVILLLRFAECERFPFQEKLDV